MSIEETMAELVFPELINIRRINIEESTEEVEIEASSEEAESVVLIHITGNGIIAVIDNEVMTMTHLPGESHEKAISFDCGISGRKFVIKSNSSRPFIVVVLELKKHIPKDEE